MEAAVVGALISGVAMYAVGARAQDDAVVETTALTADAPAPQRVATTSRFVASPQQTLARAPEPQVRVVQAPQADVEDARSERSWKKTALIIGGATASGAGVGGIINGKKGALIGAAVGGGAASIYEATRR